MLIDIPEALEALGIQYRESGAEASALCPMHERRTGKSDSNPSWFINLDTGMHICFSCGYKGNLAQLICDVNEFYVKLWSGEYGYDYASAETWLSQVSVIDIEKLQEMIAKLPAYTGPAPKPLEMSEARLAVFTEPPVSALDSRSISTESAAKYGIMWDPKKLNWILPLREPHFNRLLGWQEKGTVNRTFFNRPAGLQKSKTLFGVDVQQEDQVVLVESPLDCPRILDASGIIAVAACGSGLSDEQLKLLRYSQKIISAFDNPNMDKAGNKASKQILEAARKYGLNLFFFNYGSSGKKDPGDMTDAEICWGIDNAVSALYGESAYVQGDA